MYISHVISYTDSWQVSSLKPMDLANYTGKHDNSGSLLQRSYQKVGVMWELINESKLSN